MDHPVVRIHQKICPACATRNAEASFFCVQCGVDISAVAATETNSVPEQLPPVPRTTEVLPPIPEEVLAAAAPGVVAPPAKIAASAEHVCPKCGQRNASYLLLCGGCGADLSGAPEASPITPRAAEPYAWAPRAGAATGALPATPPPPAAPATAAPAPPEHELRNVASYLTHFAVEPPRPVAAGEPHLELVVGPRTFLCRNGDIFGREGTLASDVFSAVRTVSRRHVQVLFRAGHWFVLTPASVPNITQLDGREIPRGIPQPLRTEHRLRMSTQCEVGLRVIAPRAGGAGA